VSIEEVVTQAPMVTYQEYLDRGELGYQFSLAAEKAIFYPRVVCPYTGTTDFEWRVSEGNGTN
jgi:hypothetical protein